MCVLTALAPVGLPRRDDANDPTCTAVTVADQKQPERRAQAEQDRPLLTLRVVWVGEKECLLVKESGLSLFERDAMLPPIGGILLGVPFETRLCHRATL